MENNKENIDDEIVTTVVGDFVLRWAFIFFGWIFFTVAAYNRNDFIKIREIKLSSNNMELVLEQRRKEIDNDCKEHLLNIVDKNIKSLFHK